MTSLEAPSSRHPDESGREIFTAQHLVNIRFLPMVETTDFLILTFYEAVNLEIFSAIEPLKDSSLIATMVSKH